MKSCPNCSEESEPQFDNCWNCGAAFADESGSHDQPAIEETSEIDHAAVSNGKEKPKLGLSFLAFILFPPFGLMAVIYSILAEYSIHVIPERVQHYAELAESWRMFAFFSLVIGLFLYFTGLFPW